MEVCGTSLNYAYATNGLATEGEQDATEDSSTVPKLAASVNSYGLNDGFPLTLSASDISGAVQCFSSQLAGVSERTTPFLSDETMCHSACDTTQGCDSANDARDPDAMNQYLDENPCLMNNVPKECVENNGEPAMVNGTTEEVFSVPDDACTIALDLQCCSFCHSSRDFLKNRTCEPSLLSTCEAECQDAGPEPCCRKTNCVPQVVVGLAPDSAPSRNRIPSPEMDFLDFDFDLPPSGDEMLGGESDSSSVDEGHPVALCDSNVRHRVNGLATEQEHLTSGRSATYKNLVSSPKYQNCLKSSNRANGDTCSHGAEDSDDTDSDSGNMEACGERLLQRESSLFNIQHEEIDYGDMKDFQLSLLGSIPLAEILPPAIASSSDESLEERVEFKKNIVKVPIEKVMIWTELEACNRQVTQIGTSACGATAVINALVALKVPFKKEEVARHIKTRLRAEVAPIAQYLLSRSCAGTTHEDLINGVHSMTDGLVQGRFFHFYPSCTVDLPKWLGHWMRKGAIPVATLNLQRGVPEGYSIPDAWHHQMIFGVGPKGVYMTNPLECIPHLQIKQQLCSPSVLLVRRHDVLPRWVEDCDLGPLLKQDDERWQSMNVVGQLINIVRESAAPWIPGYRRHLTSHAKIPAAYKSGISLFVLKHTDAYKDLMVPNELV